MRYFRAAPAISAAVRSHVMAALGQPNGQADEPWGVNGDFVSGGTVYLALGPHHTEGEFWTPMIAAALAAGVEEIGEAEYMAARPQPEGVQ
jgi:hypothetical protein